MRLLLLALTAGFLFAVPTASAQASGCAAPTYPTTAGSFTSGIKAKNVSCAKAAKVALKFYECRTEKSPSGYCVHKVAHGFACREQRSSGSGVFAGTVSCSAGDGKRKVSFSYQQYL